MTTILLIVFALLLTNVFLLTISVNKTPKKALKKHTEIYNFSETQAKKLTTYNNGVFEEVV
ncbi:hypothetical protein ACG2LH_16850 [Zhouia sp. PK063]|uniref:hypothetical protein n=1 Tax=Zhouia sp. PK063 TaxID=3373602 RepID=UPI003788E798